MRLRPWIRIRSDQRVSLVEAVLKDQEKWDPKYIPSPLLARTLSERHVKG